jgi:hypothetical protein
MNKTCVRCGGGIVLAIGLVIGALAFSSRVQPAFGDVAQAGAGGGIHYTVVETEGHNLLVTDNSTSTLYFYTVDKGQPPGSDLHLRAKVDLKQVGQPTITPVNVNIQK